MVVPAGKAVEAAVAIAQATPLLRPVNCERIPLDHLPRKSRFLGIAGFMLFFVLPTGFSGWYFFRHATPMYISEMKLALRRSDKPLVQGGEALAALFNTASVAPNQDAQLILSYVNSPEMLERMNAELDLRGHYSLSDADFYARLKPDASKQDFLSYWEWAVSAKLDAASGLLLVSVKAFTPEMTREIAMRLRRHCEHFVNRLNDRVRADSSVKARQELERAEERVKLASTGLEKFRRQHGMLDLSASASMHMGLVGALEGELVKARADLAVRERYIAPNTAEIRELQTRVDVLEKQLAREKERIASSDEQNRDTLGALAAEFENLSTEQRFANSQYNMALAAIESTRLQAETQTVYLVPVSDPQLPDEPLYPRRLIFFLGFTAINFAVYIFISLVGSALKDYAGY